MEWDISLLLYGLFIGLCAGGLAGFMAGLAGVGGGLVYVPMFYILLPNSEAPMAVAIFASMVAIAMTAVVSARSHWRLGHVNRFLFFILWPGLLVGASFGLWSTLVLGEIWILLGLGLLNAWVAYDYGRVQAGKCKHVSMLVFGSFPIGYVSGVLGIAGGTMIVPLLRHFIPLKDAVGTSALCGAVMVLLASLLNVLWEPAWQALLLQQWGFLVFVWLGVLLVAPYSAKKSACLHDQFSEKTLRLILRAMFALIAIVFFVIAWLK